MTLTTTPRLGIQLMASNMAAKEMVFNEAVLAFDALFAGVVLAMQTTPPGSPADGDCYVVAVGGTGAWSGKDHDLAFYYNGWQYLTPPEHYEVYDVGTSSFIRYTVAGGWAAVAAGTPSTLSDLTDVSTAGVTDGQLLRFNATAGKWEPWTLVAPHDALANLTDVLVGTPTNGQALAWNAGASKWEPLTIPTAATAFNSLSDVDVASEHDGWIATWNASEGKVKFIDPAGLVVLDRLSRVGDVTYTGLVTGAALVWNGAAWGPSTTAIHFLFENMTDGPGTMVGAANKILIVNSLETALEYADLTTWISGVGGIRFTSLPDVPSAYTGAANKLVAVNPAANGLDFIDPPVNLVVQDEGTNVDTAVQSINFVGGEVTATEASPGHVTVTIPTPPPALGVQDHGTDVSTAPTKINFAGNATVAEAGTIVTVTVTGVDRLVDQTDVAITSPADGDLLSYNLVATKWENVSLSSRLGTLSLLSPATYEFGPFAPPTGAMFPVPLNATGMSISTQAGRGLLLVPGSYSGSNYASNTHVLVNNTAPWEITARVAVSGEASPGYHGGVTAVKLAGGGQAFCGYGSDGSLMFNYWNGSSFTTVANPSADQHQWVRLGFDGTNMHAWGSVDGLLWVQLGSVPAATIFGGIPDHVGVGHSMSSTVTSNVSTLVTYYDDPDYPAASRTTAGVATFGMSSLTDVDVTTVAPTDGEGLKWSASESKWVPGAVSSVSSLASDTDVVLTSPADGQALVYHAASSKWINGTVSGGGGGSGTLAGDTDVAITSPADGQVLAYDAASSKWKNAAVSGGGGGGPAFKATKIKSATDQVIPGGAWTLVNAWDGASVDDNAGAAWSSAHPSRLVVPTGVTKVRLTAQVTGGGGHAAIQKNQAGVHNATTTEAIEVAGQCRSGLDQSTGVMDSGWLTVTPGDYFEMFVYNGGGLTLSMTGGAGEGVTWMQLECGGVATNTTVYQNSVLVPPKAADLATIINTNGQTLVDVTTGPNPCLAIHQTASGAANLTYFLKAAPVAPWKLTVKAKLLYHPQTSGWMAAEAVVYNTGTGQAIRGPGNSDDVNRYFVSRMNSPTSEHDTTLLPGVIFGQSFEFMQIANDGTTLTFKGSQNGVDWVTLGSDAISDFIGAVTHVGLAVGNNSGNEIVAQFEHFHCGVDEGYLAVNGVLAGLGDVDLSTPPTSGQGLIYNATTNKWTPGSLTSPGSTPMAHRYWRLHNQVTNGPSVVSISSLVVRAPDGTALPVSVATATSLYGGGGNPESNMFDGLSTTDCIMTGSTDLTLDMGSAVVIHQLDVGHRELTLGATTQTLVSFDWEWSDDNIAFNLVNHVGPVTPDLSSDTSITHMPVPYHIPNAHRYWKLADMWAYANDSNAVSLFALHLYEGSTEIFPTSSYATMQYGGDGSGAGTYPTSNLFDGSDSTLWAGLNGCTVTIDLGAPHTINSVSMKTRDGGYVNETPTQFRLLYSDDGIVFRELATFDVGAACGAPPPGMAPATTLISMTVPTS